MARTTGKRRARRNGIQPKGTIDYGRKAPRCRITTENVLSKSHSHGAYAPWGKSHAHRKHKRYKPWSNK